jgi:hypothetical protein
LPVRLAVVAAAAVAVAPDADNCRFDAVACDECWVAASDADAAAVSFAVVNVVVAFADDWSELVVFLDDLGRGDSDNDCDNNKDAEEDDGASRSVRGILRGGCPPGCSRDENEADVFVFVFGRLSF